MSRVVSCVCWLVLVTGFAVVVSLHLERIDAASTGDEPRTATPDVVDHEIKPGVAYYNPSAEVAIKVFDIDPNDEWYEAHAVSVRFPKHKNPPYSRYKVGTKISSIQLKPPRIVPPVDPAPAEFEWVVGTLTHRQTGEVAKDAQSRQSLFGYHAPFKIAGHDEGFIVTVRAKFDPAMPKTPGNIDGVVWPPHPTEEWNITPLDFQDEQ